jgi:gamma-tubulin complex component 2
MDESTTSAPVRGGLGVVSASSVLILLDSLVISQPFQPGGSVADDLLLAFELARSQFGPERSGSDFVFNAISKRLDNPKRFKNKCDLIISHRPSQYEMYLVIIMKILEDPIALATLKSEGADLSPSNAEQIIRTAISQLVRSRSEVESVKKVHIDDLPRLPHWFSNRPGLSDDFVALNRAVPSSSSAALNEAGIREAPIEVQEQALVEDYLYAMMGIEGNYLALEAGENGEAKFRVLRTVTPLHDALVSLVERMLPLCECYVEINKFVDDFSEFECGLVAHALSAAISSLLRDYLVLVAQLEQQAREGRLYLQKIWFYIQTSLDSMLLLRDFIREARFFPSISAHSTTTSTSDVPPTPSKLSSLPTSSRKKRGAELLSLLFDRFLRTTSDKSANELFLFLLQKSCIPYWEMLKSWIYKGFVKDPYGEFLVEDNTTVTGSSETYWEKRYTLRESQVPVFLQPLKDKILTTGKYINAIRECGMHVNHGELPLHYLESSQKGTGSKFSSDTHIVSMTQTIEEFAFTANDRVNSEKVERAYQYASGRLLHVLRTDYGLMSKLRSVKHYFLLDQGDFFIHFMDIAEEELKPPASTVQPSTLQTLVDIAIRASVAKDDELGESMKIKLLPFNLVNQLIARHKKEPLLTGTANASDNAFPAGSLKDISALEALTLDWQVGWPLVLIFNKNTIDMYQILFRHLFYCKHVERILGRAWTMHQLTKQLFQRKRAPAVPGSRHGPPINRSRSTNTANASSNPANESTTAAKQEDDAGSDYNLLTRCFSLRQRMLHFIQNLQYYMVMEVIEPRYMKLEESLRKATTVDELLDAHNLFLLDCHRNCLLTEMDLFKIITKLLSVCVIFCNYTERFIKQITIETTAAAADASTVAPASKQGAAAKKAAEAKSSRLSVISMEGRKVLSEKGFGTTMARFEANFDKYYRMLMEATTTFQNPNFPDHGLLALNVRLDFNDFYSNHFQ